MDKTEKPRRDFLFLATGAFAALGGVFLTRAMLRPMAPSADGLAKRPEMLVDISKIAEGQQLKVSWLARPIGIRHRTSEEIKRAREDDFVELPDFEKDESRLRKRPDGTYDPRFLVVDLVCPHFGNIVIGESGQYDGWACPSHGGQFDTSGRVRQGPLAKNLAIPEYEWVSETTIRFFQSTPFERYEASQL